MTDQVKAPQGVGETDWHTHPCPECDDPKWECDDTGCPGPDRPYECPTCHAETKGVEVGETMQSQGIRVWAMEINDYTCCRLMHGPRLSCACKCHPWRDRLRRLIQDTKSQVEQRIQGEAETDSVNAAIKPTPVPSDKGGADADLLQAEIVRLQDERNQLATKGAEYFAALRAVQAATSCPFCPNVGYYPEGPTDAPEQVQCEWCWTTETSMFNARVKVDVALANERVTNTPKAVQTQTVPNKGPASLPESSINLHAWDCNRGRCSVVPESFSSPERQDGWLCVVHQRLEDIGKLEVPINGLNCVACSLNERQELLDILVPFAATDGSETTVNVLREIVRQLDCLREVCGMYCEQLPFEVRETLHTLTTIDKTHHCTFTSTSPAAEWNDAQKIVAGTLAPYMQQPQIESFSKLLHSALARLNDHRPRAIFDTGFSAPATAIAKGQRQPPTEVNVTFCGKCGQTGLHNTRCAGCGERLTFENEIVYTRAYRTPLPESANALLNRVALKHPHVGRTEGICGSKMIVGGIRIAVTDILVYLWQGHDVDYISREYGLSPEQVKCAIAFAQDFIEEADTRSFPLPEDDQESGETNEPG